MGQVSGKELPIREADDHDRLVEGVFLSPRLIDQTAFEEYASRLRLMMERIGGEFSRAEEAAQRLTALRREAEEVNAGQRKTLDLTARVAKALEARRAQAEEALARFDARTADLADVEARIDRMIESRLAEAEARLAERIGSLEEAHRARLERERAEAAERVEALVAQFAASCERAERTLVLVEGVAEAMAREVARAVGVVGRETPEENPAPGGLADLVLRGEEVAGVFRDGIERLESVRDEAEASIAGLTEAAAGVMDLVSGVSGRQAEVESDLKTALDALNELSRRLAARRAEAETVMEMTCGLRARLAGEVEALARALAPGPSLAADDEGGQEDGGDDGPRVVVRGSGMREAV